MKKSVVQVLKFCLFLGIGLAIMTWLYNGQNASFQEQLQLEGKEPYPLLRKIFDDFKSVNLFWIGTTLMAFSISNWSRAIRWNMLIEPLGHEPKTLNAFFAVNISYFTNLWLSRAGEVVRASALAKSEGMSVSRVMGTVVVDRLLDLLSLGLIVGFSFIVQYDILWSWLDRNLGEGNGSFRLLTHPLFIGLMSVGGIALVSAYLLRKKIAQLPMVNKVWHIVEKFSEGLKTIRKVKNPIVFVFHSINIWVMYYFMTYLCFFAFAPTENLSPFAALTVFVFGTFGIVIPSPGGMGTYHFLAMSALGLYGLKGDDAFSFANIMFFSIQIFYNIVAGLLSIYLLRKMNKNAPLSTDALLEGTD
ncbi:MAG: lysylphosphatidylglycerol synthase transmembrane domain-containing protein [Saprospiraceae bacterium]|nr:lysylphosphatidylglycerol synthase transmembrane domain-containing protein [Saprospiraceae bacterium]